MVFNTWKAVVFALLCSRLACGQGGYEVTDWVVVSPSGNDSNAGTYASPLLTLAAAQTKVRSMTNNTGITVMLRAGTYRLTTGLSLTSSDSGTPQKRITWMSYPGESAVISGSQVLPSGTNPSDINARLPAGSQANVDTYDLSGESWVTAYDFGESSLDERDIVLTNYTEEEWMCEVFVDGVRQRLARYPDWETNTEVIDQNWYFTKAGGNASATFDVHTSQAATVDTWSSVTAPPLWYWGIPDTSAPYRDSYRLVTGWDGTTNDRFTLTSVGYPAMTTAGDAEYSILNIAENLTRVGTYVSDLDANSKLHGWFSGTTKTISVCKDPLIKCDGVSNVTFRNLTFEEGRDRAVHLLNSASIIVGGCTIRNMGNLSIQIGNTFGDDPEDYLADVDHDFEGGTNNLIDACIIHDSGRGGIEIAGGDRRTLQQCNNVVRNCHIYDYSIHFRNYHPAVRIKGCGVDVKNNLIHGSSHEAIEFGGNDHIIEYNRVFDVCRETGDAGVIYAWSSDWLARGTVIRYNELSCSPAVNGIYLDDFASGINCYQNIIAFANRAFLVGGGRDNTIENNVIVGFASTSLTTSGRGVSWASGSIATLDTKLAQVDVTASPWTKYPNLSTLSGDDDRDLPENTSFTNNLEVRTNLQTDSVQSNATTSLVYVDFSSESEKSQSVSFSGSANLQDANSYQPTGWFVDSSAVTNRDFELESMSDPIGAGFPVIPQSSIGLYEDTTYGLISSAYVASAPSFSLQSSSQSAFTGTDWAIPGTIYAHQYDLGGADVSWHVEGNNRENVQSDDKRYRNNVDPLSFHLVDIDNDGEGTYFVALNVDEWVEFSVDVATSTNYDIVIKYYPLEDDTNCRILFGGVDKTGSVTLTASSPNLGSVTVSTVALTSGTQVMRIVGTSGRPIIARVEITES